MFLLLSFRLFTGIYIVLNDLFISFFCLFVSFFFFSFSFSLPFYLPFLTIKKLQKKRKTFLQHTEEKNKSKNKNKDKKQKKKAQDNRHKRVPTKPFDPFKNILPAFLAVRQKILKEIVFFSFFYCDQLKMK